jgi:transcriptional regulator with XRE-family HTH domain
MAKRLKALPTPDLNANLSAALLGQAIRARRTQSRLRLEDAATLCGVSKQTLADIERGEGKSQMNLVLQICAGLGIQLRILPWFSDIEMNDDWQ